MTERRLNIAQLLAKGTSGGDLDPYFDYFFGTPRAPVMSSDKGWQPSADLYETDTDIVIVIDIAGISIKDINLTLAKQSLLLQGTRQEDSRGQTRQYHKMEIAYGPFELTFQLPSSVQPDNVQADYKDGLLTIRFVKCEKSLKRRLTIKIR